MTEDVLCTLLAYEPQMPDFEHAGAEPCLKEMVFRYYRAHFREERAQELTDQYTFLLLDGLAANFLPEGLYEHGGKIMFDCLVCHSPSEWFGDSIKDFNIDDIHNVCGGSPRCCP